MKTNYVIVSFYTDEYIEVAKRLRESVAKFPQLSFIMQYKQSRGTWIKNCAMKAEFCRDMLLELRKPILWVDADAVIYQEPVLMDKLFTQKYDLAAYMYKGQLCSGTLYLNNTITALSMVDLWCDWSARLHYDDQTYLQMIVKAYGYNLFELPPQYCKIFDLMATIDNPVIEHFQHSRVTKRKEAQEQVQRVLNGRKVV